VGEDPYKKSSTPPSPPIFFLSSNLLDTLASRVGQRYPNHDPVYCDVVIFVGDEKSWHLEEKKITKQNTSPQRRVTPLQGDSCRIQARKHGISLFPKYQKGTRGG
jgi:hypothetical protein